MITWDNKQKEFVVTEDSQISISDDCRVGNNITIKVLKSLSIERGGTINDHCIIQGVDISFGKYLWMDTFAEIGAGSCFTPFSKLLAGDYFHLGKYGLINTARAVTIGEEVGLGVDTRIFTHGAWLSALGGFPVSFAPL